MAQRISLASNFKPSALTAYLPFEHTGSITLDIKLIRYIINKTEPLVRHTTTAKHVLHVHDTWPNLRGSYKGKSYCASLKRIKLGGEELGRKLEHDLVGRMQLRALSFFKYWERRRLQDTNS